MERYKYLCTPERISEILPSSFTKSSFFEVLATQTNHLPTDSQWKAYRPLFYEQLQRKYERDAVIKGDKVPGYFRQYAHLRKNFPGAKFIFLLRDIYHVAESYNKRAKEGRHWSASRDYRQVVFDWNEALLCTVEAMQVSRHDIFVVEFEKLYMHNLEYLQKIFAFVGMPVTKEVEIFYKNMVWAEPLRFARQRVRLTKVG